MNTRKTDEELLIRFVEDQGFDQIELVEAAERLKLCIKKELQDYSTSPDVMKEEKPVIERFVIENSSNAVSSGWSDGILAVEFKGGTVYHYFDVPLEKVQLLMAAESFGKYLNSDIKPYFKCEKQ